MKFDNSVCEICGKTRVIGNHEKCSKIRQQNYIAKKKPGAAPLRQTPKPPAINL